MSLTNPVLGDGTIYGTNPNLRLTDVVSTDLDRIDPNTKETIINDSSTPLVLSLGGAVSTITKNIKLLSNIGATINTNGGTIILDSNNTSTQITYDSVRGYWVSDPAGLVIPTTQKRAYIVSSGSIESAKSLSFGSVGQGALNSVVMSSNGKIVASGGSGFSINTRSKGVIWVLERDGFDWVEKHRLFASLPVIIGYSTVISKTGTTIATGVPGFADTPGDPVGSVVVFEYNTINKEYKETIPAVINTPPTPDDPAIYPRFPDIPGFVRESEGGVDMISMNDNGDIIVISGRAGNSDFPSSGVVWVYKKNTSTLKWSLLQILDGFTFLGDDYGRYLDISADGSTIVVVGNDNQLINTYLRTQFPVKQQFTITASGVTAAIDGKYIVITARNINITKTFAVWFDTTGSTSAPSAGVNTYIKVDLSAIVFPNDNAVATAIHNALSLIAYADYWTSSVNTNVVTVTHKYAGSFNRAVDSTEEPTGLILDMTIVGASEDGYTSGPSIVTSLVGNLSLNANGTVLAAACRDGIHIYSRTTSWTEDALMLDEFAPFSSTLATPQGFSENEISLDINAFGNVLIVGDPYYYGGDGTVWTLANTDGTWRIKSGPTRYLDETETGLQPFKFGSDVSISGDGNLAMVGGVNTQDPTLGVKFVYNIVTTGIAVGPSSYFVVISPIEAGTPSVKHVIWYKTSNGSFAPPANPPFFNPALFWKTIEVDVRGLNLPAQNDRLVQETVKSMNANSEFSYLFTAAADGETIKITSKFSGTTGSITDASDVSPPTPFYPTNFTFNLTTPGEAAPLTGAIWPFA